MDSNHILQSYCTSDHTIILPCLQPASKVVIIIIIINIITPVLDCTQLHNAAADWKTSSPKDIVMIKVANMDSWSDSDALILRYPKMRQITLLLLVVMDLHVPWRESMFAPGCI